MCVCVYIIIVYERMRSMCVLLMCLHAPKSLPKAQLPSFWRMVPFHLIYLSRKWTIHFFFSFFPPWFVSLTAPPPSPFSLSFNSLYLIISSSPAVWLFPPVSNCAGDTTWSSSPPLGIPSIPTFPSLCKVRSLDRSAAVELRDVFLMKTSFCLLLLSPPSVCCWCEQELQDLRRGRRRRLQSQSLITSLFIFTNIWRQS